LPIQIKYLDNETGVMLIAEGTITADDIIISIQTLFSSTEKMKQLKYCLMDYSNNTQLNVSNANLRVIADLNKKASVEKQEGVVAIVANNDFVFGISRMWEFFIDNAGVPWETMVFRDKGKAENWIKQKVSDRGSLDIAVS